MSDSLVARTEFGNALGRLPRDNPHVIEVAPILRDLFDALLAERDTAVMERDQAREAMKNQLFAVSASIDAARNPVAWAAKMEAERDHLREKLAATEADMLDYRNKRDEILAKKNAAIFERDAARELGERHYQAMHNYADDNAKLMVALTRVAESADRMNPHATGTYWPGCECPPCIARAALDREAPR